MTKDQQTGASEMLDEKKKTYGRSEESHEMCVCKPVEHHGQTTKKPRQNTGAKQAGETMTRKVNGITEVREAQGEQTKERSRAIPLEGLKQIQTPGTMHRNRCRLRHCPHRTGRKSRDEKSSERSSATERITGSTTSESGG